jgi:hypothetical protein
VIAFFVAATVVTLLQWFRLRRGSLLALAAVFACLALSESQPEWSPWRDRFQAAAGGSGLVLLYVLSPRRSANAPAGAGSSRAQ